MFSISGRRQRCALSREQARDRDVLVESLPVPARAAEFDLFARRRRGVAQAQKRCERHAKRLPVGQFDPHGILVKADAGWRDGHAEILFEKIERFFL